MSVGLSQFASKTERLIDSSTLSSVLLEIVQSLQKQGEQISAIERDQATRKEFDWNRFQDWTERVENLEADVSRLQLETNSKVSDIAGSITHIGGRLTNLEKELSTLKTNYKAKFKRWKLQNKTMMETHHSTLQGKLLELENKVSSSEQEMNSKWNKQFQSLANSKLDTSTYEQMRSQTEGNIQKVVDQMKDWSLLVSRLNEDIEKVQKELKTSLKSLGQELSRQLDINNQQISTLSNLLNSNCTEFLKYQ